MASELWAHQQQTYDFSNTKTAVFDSSEPGTGKTRAHLEVFAARLRAGHSSRCLILAPKSLLRPAWFQDAQRFTPQLRCSIAYAENRQAAFDTDADVYITNIDAVKWLAKQSPTWLKTKFPPDSTLIIDELTSVKNRTSARSRATAKLAKLFTFRVGLTGTPNPRSVTELWHQIFILDDGQHLGKNFFAFRNVTQTPQIRSAFTEWQDKPGIEFVVGQLISDISIRHEFEKCMSIPPNHTYTRPFELSSKLRAAYEEMLNTCILELEKGNIKAINAAVLQNKLLQILSGMAFDQTHTAQFIDDQRYEFITDLIEECAHSITFFNWTHQKERLAHHLTQRNIPFALLDGSTPVKQRERIVTAYQAGEYQTLLLHPQTGAHGLTLTRGTRTIWSSPIFQADFLVQGRHRVYRGGQTQRTETILIEAENTIEPILYAKLNDKEQRMSNLLEIIRESR